MNAKNEKEKKTKEGKNIKVKKLCLTCSEFRVLVASKSTYNQAESYFLPFKACFHPYPYILEAFKLFSGSGFSSFARDL